MLSRLFRGAVIGLLAAYGATAVGLGGTTAAILFAIPVFVTVVDVLVGEVYSLCVLFGLGTLIWTYTPLGTFARDNFSPSARTEVNKEVSLKQQGASEQGPIQAATATSNK
jgi:hypothetical protein